MIGINLHLLLANYPPSTFQLFVLRNLAAARAARGAKWWLAASLLYGEGQGVFSVTTVCLKAESTRGGAFDGVVKQSRSEAAGLFRSDTEDTSAPFFFCHTGC